MCQTRNKRVDLTVLNDRPHFQYENKMRDKERQTSVLYFSSIVRIKKKITNDATKLFPVVDQRVEKMPHPLNQYETVRCIRPGWK